MNTVTKQRDINNKLISITAPALNEGDNLEDLFERIIKAIEKITKNFEIVIVDNGSSDKSRELLKSYSSKDDRIKYVFLSKNFGHQGGLIAGMAHCSGDIIITMDADLQHPPEVIPELLEKWKEGYDVVGTIKHSNDYTHPIRRISNRIFYKLIGIFTGIPLSQHQSDFRLLDKKALDALLSLPEREKFLRGLSYWIGFNQTSISFYPSARSQGDSKFNTWKLIGFALHGVISFTSIPLRIFTFIGFFIAIISMINAGYIFFDWLFNKDGISPPGWLTLATGIYFLGGIQLIGLGVVGEYLAQNLVETRKRPSFIVQETNIKRSE